MTHFVADVIHFEKETGGDENIFKQFEEKEVHKPLQININELFTTEKSRKSKARKSVSVRGRRSLPASKISTPLPIKKKPSTPKTISKSKPVSTTLSLNNTSINQKYVCYFDTQNKCSFFTNRFELLKRHMAEHKAKAELMKQSATSSNNSNTNTQLSTSTSIKRNCAKPKKSCTKKIKLHDEILKEWDIDEAEDSNDKVNEGEDKNKLDTNSVENEGKEEDKKVFVTNTVEGGKENDLDKSSVEDEKNTNINKVENEKNDFDANTNEDKNVVENISQGTSGLDNNVEEDISTMNKLKENIPHTIFDFDEDDSSNYIPDLRPSKSDINSTLDDEINDSFGHKCDQEFITSTIFESTKSQPHVKESETEDTNDFENEIESSKLLLKKTVNTLDQICNLEESMNNISSNKSKLIGDNQSSESLNEIVKNNVDAGDYLIKSPVEMQQSNDNEESSSYMVNDDENKKLCSNEDSTHMQNIETEDVDPTENGRYECLLDGLPSPDWIKEDSWESFPENGLQEGKK